MQESELFQSARNETLIHFFPQKFTYPEKALSTLSSILENGLYLSYEQRSVPWPDRYGKNSNRVLTFNQRRFCLTAISNLDEMKNHAIIFGCIGLEFTTHFIKKLGGFPVFYVPTPEFASTDREDYVGVSLLYRIAEAQEIMEFIVSNNALQAPEIDFDNTLGAMRFLANICYPTHGGISPETGGTCVYYSEREWRIIHGLTPESVVIDRHNDNYAIKTYADKPIRNFIRRVVLCNTDQVAASDLGFLRLSILQILVKYGIDIPVDIIE